MSFLFYQKRFAKNLFMLRTVSGEMPVSKFFDHIVGNTECIGVDRPGIGRTASGRHETGIGHKKVGNIVRLAIGVQY